MTKRETPSVFSMSVLLGLPRSGPERAWATLSSEPEITSPLLLAEAPKPMSLSDRLIYGQPTQVARQSAKGWGY